MRVRPIIDVDQQSEAAVQSSSLIKMATGVCNNATWLVMLDAHDKAKTLPRYRGQVKHAFKLCFDAWKQYELRLLHTNENRMFHVADMDSETRKKYSEHITDKEYFEFWQGFGFSAYQKTKPFLTSLVNKYRLSLINHKQPNAEELAWVMTAQAALEISGSILKEAINECVETFSLRRDIAEDIFGQFSVEEVAQRWKRAMLLLEPGCIFDLDDVESRNIEMGLVQLAQAWSDTTTAMLSVHDTVDDYEEMFVNSAQRKKEKREIKKIIKGL